MHRIGTIIQENYWSFYPSWPFRIIHFNVRYPVVDTEMSDNEDVCAEEEKNTVIKTESNNPEEMKSALQGQSTQTVFF